MAENQVVTFLQSHEVQSDKRRLGPHMDKQVLEITKGRNGSRGGGRSTVGTGTTDVRASKAEIPKREIRRPPRQGHRLARAHQGHENCVLIEGR